MVKNGVTFNEIRIAEFCRKWKIRELALFGSILRDDFRPDSDVDVLVEFEIDAPWDLFDFALAREELIELFGRRVDFIEKFAVENPYIKQSIREASQVIYDSKR